MIVVLVVLVVASLAVVVARAIYRNVAADHMIDRLERTEGDG